MSDNKGSLSVDQSHNLLQNVSQRSAYWTVINDMASHLAHVATERNFNQHDEFEVDGRQNAACSTSETNDVLKLISKTPKSGLDFLGQSL